jgi:hypothetical protein
MSLCYLATGRGVHEILSSFDDTHGESSLSSVVSSAPAIHALRILMEKRAKIKKLIINARIGAPKKKK